MFDCSDALLNSPKSHVLPLFYRKKNADPHSLVPLGSKSDFVEPAVLEAQKKEQEKLKSAAENLGVTFGSAGQSTVIGAAYSLEDMMKKAAEQPGKYYDDRSKVSGGVTTTGDSQYTREKLAPDLLDLDFGSGGLGRAGSVMPKAEDLVTKQREEDLKAELQKKDEQMKTLLAQQQQQMAQQQQQIAAMQQQQQQQAVMMQGGGMFQGNGGYVHGAMMSPQVQIARMQQQQMQQAVMMQGGGMSPQMHQQIAWQQQQAAAMMQGGGMNMNPQQAALMQQQAMLRHQQQQQP